MENSKIEISDYSDLMWQLRHSWARLCYQLSFRLLFCSESFSAHYRRPVIAPSAGCIQNSFVDSFFRPIKKTNHSSSRRRLSQWFSGMLSPINSRTCYCSPWKIPQNTRSFQAMSQPIDARFTWTDQASIETLSLLAPLRSESYKTVKQYTNYHSNCSPTICLIAD